MTSLRALALAVSLLATFIPTFDARAEDDTEEEDRQTVLLTGLKAFDDVFERLQSIDATLAGAEQRLKTSRRDLVTALALPKGTPIADALADLKDKADGKITVAMKGKQPALQPSDAVPANVQSGIDAVNRLTEGIAATMDDLASLPAEVKDLVDATGRFPDRVKAELQKAPGAKITQAPKILKALGQNAQITAGLPDRSEKVVSRSIGMLDVVRATFPLGGGPSAAGDGAGEPAGGGAEPEGPSADGTVVSPISGRTIPTPVDKRAGSRD